MVQVRRSLVRGGIVVCYGMDFVMVNGYGQWSCFAAAGVGAGVGLRDVSGDRAMLSGRAVSVHTISPCHVEDRMPPRGTWKWYIWHERLSEVLRVAGFKHHVDGGCCETKYID